uniref:Immunoglobulin V-set domain-containing protein n=1 Tax=Pseudonaja textilis TaxID=8673 RepID=A0A670ZCR0_PSETE
MVKQGLEFGLIGVALRLEQITWSQLGRWYFFHINPKVLVAWTGSCVLIPCQIEERMHSKKILPFGNNSWSKGKTTLLYNSSQNSGTITTVSDDALPSRIWFLGNLTNRDCSLLINPVRMLDSGTYEVKVIVSKALFSISLCIFPQEASLVNGSF